MRLSRKIFASFLANLYSNPKENRDIDYYRIIDSIYYQKEPGKSINFDFLEFYRYYYNSLDKYFSEVISTKYVICTADSTFEQNMVKNYYTYKKIELDSELIMKCLCVLEQIDGQEETKKAKEKMFKNDYLLVLKNKTKNLDILNAIEKYYFDNNLLNYKEIIRLSLLNYIILTIPKKQLVYFNKSEYYTPDKDAKKLYNNFVYDLFDCIYLFKNKYIEMLLSTAYRYFNNSNLINHFYIQPYLDIYECCVIKRKIFKSEDIFNLYKSFKTYAEKAQRKYTPKYVDHKDKDLLDNNSEDLYEFEQDLDTEDVSSKAFDSKFDGKIIEEKINMKYKYENKNASCDTIYSPKKLYNIINKVMKDFYVKLEIKDNNVDTMKEIAIYLLYYCHL